jgi:alpha-1,3-rhamnosyl/mannosyltransferase
MLPAGRPIVVDGRYLSDRYPGVGRWVYELLLALPAVDPARRVRALVDRDASQRRFDLDALVSRGVELVPARTPRSLRGQLTAAGACRREAAAVYHAPHVLSAGRVPCASVVTLYDTIPLRDARAIGPAHRRLAFGLLLRRALARATRVITLTEATRRDIVRSCGVPPERITVAGAAAGPQFRPAAVDAVDALRRRLGLRGPYALYVGSSKPHKNLVRLVEAWAEVTRRRAGIAPLVLAGPPDPRYPEARARARSLPAGSVIFAGEVDEADLPALYSGARLVVHASLHEGFGLPILEAMRCGAPVACSRTPDLVEVCNGAAEHFDPADVTDMADTIGRVFDDEERLKDLVARGAARAAAFSWRTTAALTLDAYRHAWQDHAARGHGR